MKENTEKLFLCRPCAEKMKTMRTCKSVVLGAPHKEKGTCEQCCRRRYGYDCEVEFNYDLDNEWKKENNYAR